MHEDRPASGQRLADLVIGASVLLTAEEVEEARENGEIGIEIR